MLPDSLHQSLGVISSTGWFLKESSRYQVSLLACFLIVTTCPWLELLKSEEKGSIFVGKGMKYAFYISFGYFI